MPRARARRPGHRAGPRRPATDATLAQGRSVCPRPVGDRHAVDRSAHARSPPAARRRRVGCARPGVGRLDATEAGGGPRGAGGPRPPLAGDPGRAGLGARRAPIRRRYRRWRPMPARSSGGTFAGCACRCCTSMANWPCATCTCCSSCTASPLTGSAPVKALADALGHEHDHGRVVRVRRGRLRAHRSGHGPQPRADPELGTAPEDWYPALVAWLSGRAGARRRGHPRPAPRWPAGTCPGRGRRRPWRRGGSGRRRPR